MVPILHRRQTLESLLDALVVVPVNVVIDRVVKLIQLDKRLTVIHLCFEMSEEVLHDRVVVAVAFP